MSLKFYVILKTYRHLSVYIEIKEVKERFRLEVVELAVEIFSIAKRFDVPCEESLLGRSTETLLAG